MSAGNHLGNHPGEECREPRPEPSRAFGLGKPGNQRGNHSEPPRRTLLGTDDDTDLEEEDVSIRIRERGAL